MIVNPTLASCGCLLPIWCRIGNFSAPPRGAKVKLLFIAIATVLQITTLDMAIVMADPRAMGIFKRMFFQKNLA